MPIEIVTPAEAQQHHAHRGFWACTVKFPRCLSRSWEPRFDMAEQWQAAANPDDPPELVGGHVSDWYAEIMTNGRLDVGTYGFFEPLPYRAVTPFPLLWALLRVTQSTGQSSGRVVAKVCGAVRFDVEAVPFLSGMQGWEGQLIHTTDRVAWLVYADWLRDHGLDACAEVLMGEFRQDSSV